MTRKLLKFYFDDRVTYKDAVWANPNSNEFAFYAVAEYNDYHKVWGVYHLSKLIAEVATREEAIATLDGLCALEGY